MTPDSVKELLDSDDYGDRLSGVNKLRDLDPAVAYEMIQPLIVDSNARVRYSAVSQMDTLGQCDLQRTRELLRDRLLTDKELDVRAAAADAISALKLTDLFDDLVALYREMDDSTGWLVKMSIVAALGEMGDARAFDLLQEALQSDIDAIKTAAIGSLGELKDERAIPLLLAYTQDEDWQIRYRLAQALIHFDRPETRSALEELQKDPEPAVAQLVQALL
ncbi:phycobilisome degradation protein NblB [Oscillatoria sp. FACHB-1406]|uniref:phycobilisome degradation protein NblB n=1 Tax=Oscillatoria sp. FACHB-1406 TaxID=2692846 RepID=UPI001689074E|nr:HEAT repeat domain-containing protein [Oscillatoria sp. FACHB-1406]MBD2580386.1 HEAT repeat domain-containing protein [Oscillatoria sp. FACHB-1406]